MLFSLTDCFEEMHFTNSLNRESLKLINTAVSRARKMLILVGDADNWKGKPGQLISELFAVGKEIPERERVAEKLCPDREPPWMGNYGSLFMAPGLDE